METDQWRIELGRFVTEIIADEYGDPPNRVFGDGRGFWNVYLPTEVSDILRNEHGSLNVLREFVSVVITWQSEYYRRLTAAKPPEIELRVFAMVSLPILGASVQVIYSDEAERLCFDFYKRARGELVPIRSRMLTDRLRISRPPDVSELGFTYSSIDSNSINFDCGEFWLLGSIPPMWRDLWLGKGPQTVNEA